MNKKVFNSTWNSGGSADMNNRVYGGDYAVFESSADVRSRFIIKTYMHLLGAVLGFVGMEFYLFQSGLAESITQFAINNSWLIFLGAFMVVSWIATHFAQNPANKGMQYIGLALYVVAESVIFVPLLYIAENYARGAIQSAAIATLIGFGVLTGIVFISRKDFSFLRGVLIWGSFVAFAVIILAVIFGIQLGIFFSVAMIAFAGAAILYDTSNVLHHYPEEHYVAASLQLFASVALLFFYILRLFILARD